MAIRYQGDNRLRRGGAIVATALVHALLLLMIMWARGPSSVVSMSPPGLSVFDVVPPPPPVIVPVQPPLPPQSVRLTARDGGSPDRAKPAPVVAYSAPTRHVEILAAPLPAQTPHGEIPLPGLANISASSTDAGIGSGEGEAGRGKGTGTGDGRAGLARALWISIPSPREFETHWPEQARRDRIPGRVMLSCIVPRPGPPRRCKVIDEYPKNKGFGESALRMSGLFRIKPVTRGPEVQKLPVIVPISFQVPMEIKLPSGKD